MATLSLTELDLGKLKSYPYPVTNVLSVNLENIRSGTYNIIDLNGSVINASEFLVRDILEIETSALQSVIYIFIIQTESGVFNLRFIKQ